MSGYYIYAIGDPNIRQIKIGYAKDLEQRVQQYLTHNPSAVLLHYEGIENASAEDAALAERMVHYALNEHRKTGEWFSVELEIAKKAIALACEYTLALARFMEDNANVVPLRKVE